MSITVIPSNDSETIQTSPLISDNPTDTMNRCAAVLDYLAALTPGEGADTDDVHFGRSLLLETLAHALRTGNSQS